MPKGGIRSAAAALEVAHILRYGTRFVLSPSIIHIPTVENWQMDYLHRQMLDKDEWSLHPEVFHQLCLHWGTLDVDLLASRLNWKVPRLWQGRWIL